MENRYNLHDLEASFKKYLLAENISSVTLKNYLSDIRHFIGWLLSKNIHIESSLKEVLRSIASEQINTYKEELNFNNIPIKTINRRLSTLRKFYSYLLVQGFVKTRLIDKITNVKKGKAATPSVIPSKVEESLSLSKNGTRIRERSFVSLGMTIGRYKTYWTKIFKTHFAYAIIIAILFSSIGYTYANRSKNKPLTLAASSNLFKGRTLFFSGKLTDPLGNPITNRTDVTFQIYNSIQGGSALYKGGCLGENAVSPDRNGNFTSIVGIDCNMSKIPNSIFSENQSLYLGITIGLDTEMKPRQKIANVEYANNTNLLQGLSIGITNSSIPYINELGEVLITADSPSIRSTIDTANFTISSAKSLNLESAGLGDVVLSASESGAIVFKTNGNEKMYLDNDGRLGIGTTSPKQKLEVKEGDINIDYGYGLKVNNSALSGYYLRGDGTRYSPSLIQPADLPNSALGFIDNGNIVRLSSDTDKIGIGLSNPDAKLQITNANQAAIGKALMILDQSEKQNILVASASGAIKMAVTYEGRLGLGTGNPSYQLHLSEDSAAKPTSNTWTVVSDARLKENITPFNDGLSVLERINPVNYTLNGKANTPKGSKGIGIIAQEVKDIIPYTISRFKAKESLNINQETEYFSFDSSALTFVLINAVKDLNNKINQIINSEKFISPLVETDQLRVNDKANINKIETHEIKSADDKLVIDISNEEKGKLSALIIKGLEGRTVATISAQGDIITEGNVSAKNASFSGTLSAKEIDAENIKALENKVDDYLTRNQTATQESDLTNQINEIQATLAQIKTDTDNVNTITESSTIDNQQFDTSTIQQLTINDNLTVTGKANLYDASIANSLNVGQLFFNDNSISSLGLELKFSAIAKINFFDGDVIISKGGNVVIKGNLTANNITTHSIEAQSANFNDITVNQINVDKYLDATSSAAIIAAPVNYDTNGLNSPAIETKTKTVGIGILPANSREIVIYNDKIKDNSLIYITPTSTTAGKSLYVSEKNTCAEENNSCKKYFKIAVDAAIANDIKFNWWIVN